MAKITILSVILSLMTLLSLPVCSQSLHGGQGWWCLSDFAGRKAPDNSGNGIDGIAFGAPSLIEDSFGKTLYFEGDSSYIEIPHSALLDVRNFTVSAWFKSAGDGRDGFTTIMSRLWRDKNQSSVHDVFSILINRKPPSFEVYYNFNGNEANPEPEYLPTNFSIETNVWYMISVTKNGRSIVIYINGSPTSIVTLSADNDPFRYPGSWLIGSQIDNGRIWGPFKGASKDVRIYSRALSGDEIDALFKLGSGTALSRNHMSLDFGTLQCLPDTTITISLRNNLKIPFEFEALNFSNGEAFFVDNQNTLPLAPDESRMFTLRFFPNKPRYYWDSLIIRSQFSCEPVAIMPVMGFRADIDFDLSEVEGDTLDFGRVCPLDAKEIKLLLKNKSSVKTVFHISEPVFPFAISGVKGYIPLDTNLTAEIAIQFSAERGKYIDSISVADTCGNLKKLYLKAESSLVVTIYLPDTIAFYGDRLCIPVIAESECKFDNQAKVNIDVEFLKGSFLPDNEHSVRLDGDKAIVKLNGLSLTQKGDNRVSGYLCGRALLPDEAITPLIVSDISFEGIVPDETNIVNGKLIIAGCAMELAKVRLYKPAEMTIASINGFASRIVVAGGETGIFHLSIYDSFGRLIERISWENSANNVGAIKVIELNAIELPSGMYFAMLQTPMQIIAKKLQIID